MEARTLMTRHLVLGSFLTIRRALILLAILLLVWVGVSIVLAASHGSFTPTGCNHIPLVNGKPAHPCSFK